MSLSQNIPKALITGSSRGIGLAIAKRLHTLGYEVILVARDKERLQKIEESLKNRILTYAIDLSCDKNSKEFLDFLEFIIKNLPSVVIHNVGGKLECDSQPLDYEYLMKSIDLNLGVAVSINHKILPFLKPKSHLLFISSDSALTGNGAPGYVASKAALNAYIKSTARFYAKNEIIINGIMPGIVEFCGSAWDKKKECESEKYSKVKEAQPLGRFGTLEEISSFVEMLIIKNNMLTTGEIFLLNGGV